MRRQHSTTAAALLAVFTITGATAAWAQEADQETRRRSHERAARADSQDRADRGTRSGTAVRRSEPRSDTRNDGDRAARNQGSAQDIGRQQGSRNSGSGRYGDDWRVNGGGSYGGYDNRNRGNHRNDYRYDNRYDYRNDGRYGNGRYDDRYYGQGRYPYYGGRYDGPYAWRNHIRFGLGISVFAGSPFRFHFSYGWRAPFAYHYPMRSGIAYGGMAFVVDPPQTQVFVDGVYVGLAGDFRGQPVPIAAGYRRIELYAPGYEPIGFNVNVLPGQVIPYQGRLYGAGHYGY
jgi:hypothetical protein